MSQIDKIDVENLLRTYIDPNHGVDLVTAKSVKLITIIDSNIDVFIELGYPAKSTITALKSSLVALLNTLKGVGVVNVEVTVNILSHAVQQALKPYPNIKNIIAVASGKGG